MKYGRHCPKVSHLFFVDDSIIFSRAKEEDYLAIREILEVYEKGLGQKINLAKSAITYGPNVSGEDRQVISSILSLDNSLPHDTYLGHQRQGLEKGPRVAKRLLLSRWA